MARLQPMQPPRAAVLNHLRHEDHLQIFFSRSRTTTENFVMENWKIGVFVLRNEKVAFARRPLCPRITSGVENRWHIDIKTVELTSFQL